MSIDWLKDRERGAPEQHVYVSPCCKAELIKLGKQVVKRTSPGVTRYYQQKCSKCGEPCHLYTSKIFDSAGVLIEPVDLIECPETPEDYACHWHAAYWCYSIEGISIRDLGHNNVYMYDLDGPYLTRGPYWLHLDKLSDESLEYYWNTTRKEAKQKGKV